MTKKFMLVLMLSIMFTLGFAQASFTQDFEDAWTGTPLAPTGWTNYSTTSSVSWIRTTTNPFAGANCARVGYSTGNHWLVSPALAIPAGNQRLKFMARDHSASTSYDYPDEYFKVFVSTTFGGTVDVFTTPVLTLGYLETNVTYAPYTVDLSAYAGQTIYIAMERISTSGNYVYVDDFTIEPILPIPPNASTLAFPANTMTTVANPLLKWVNSSTGELSTGIKVYLSTTSTFGEPVATLSGSATSYQTTGLTPGTTYYWKVVPFNANGDASGNAEYTFVTPGAYQLAESFEGAVFPPVGWNKDASTWTQNTANAIEGSKSSTCTTGTVVTPETSRKLITPKLTITATSSISFIAATSATTVQYLTVLTSPDRVTWTNLTATPITLTTSWTLYTTDLSSLAGQNLYVAIGCYRATASGSVFVDHVIGPDITQEAPGIASTPVPADAATAVLEMPTLSWVAPTTGGIPSGYKVYIDTVTPPVTLAGTVNTTSFTPAAFLSYNTLYYWSIVPTNIAGDATGCPVWSFTTIPDPTLNIPVAVDFATYPPANWVERSGLLVDPVVLTGTSSAWGAATSFANDATNPNGASVKINNYGTSKKDWMITPPINLGTTGGLQLEFDLALTAWNVADTAGVAPDDKFAVIVSTDNGLTWSTTNILRMWDNDSTSVSSSYDGISLTGEHVTIPLTQTGIVKFGFYAESTVGNGDNDLFIDNVQVRETPTQPVFAITPTEKAFGITVINTPSPAQIFTISNSGSGALTINSVALSGANADQFILTDTNVYPTNIVNDTTRTFTVAFLPTTVGEKTATITVTDNLTRTAHEVVLTGLGFDPTINTPHTQNFDTLTIPALPAGWVTYTSHTGTDARPWVTQSTTSVGNHSAPNVVANFYHSTFPKNEWLVSPNVMLTAGNHYRIKFWVKAPGYSGIPEKMKVVVANNQSLTAITAGTVIWDNPNMLIGAYTEKMISFTPTTTGAYYFGWNSYSDVDVNYIALDDITFEEGTVNVPPTALSVIGGNHYVDLAWTAPTAGSTGTLSGYKVYRDSTLITATPLAPTALTYTDNNVTNGTTYAYYVTAVYANPAGESAPSNTVHITPLLPLLLPPTNLTASVVTDDVTLNWATAEPQGIWITKGGTYASSIGTNSANNFSVAHRFTAGQLDTLGVAGGQLYSIKFIGHVPEATYAVKVWTGGSANPYNPGTLAYTQISNTITVDDWTVVNFATPVNIPTTGELWIGYNVDTPYGYPAGADAGPVSEGYGNLMYINNAWTTLTALSATLTKNWCIQGFASTPAGSLAKLEIPKPAPQIKEVMNLTPAVTTSMKKSLISAIETSMVPHTNMIDRNLTGYKVYRGTTLLTATPLAPTVLTYVDNNVANGTYSYNVTAQYSNGESAPATIQVIVANSPNITVFPWDEGFEGETFPPAGWSLIDADNDTHNWLSMVNGNTNIAHTGTKVAASESYINNVGALTPDNWLVTPKIELPTYGAGQTAKLKYWITAQDAAYPQEHYSVMLSTTNTDIASFTEIYNSTLSSATWEQKMIQLTGHSNQDIYIAFRHHNCTDMFRIKLDDVHIEVGTGIDDNMVAVTKLSGNYPNPFNPTTTIAFDMKERANVSIDIYNIKGQKVKSLINEVKGQGHHTALWNGKDDNNKNTGSGIYFYRMKSGNYTATGKMILMK